jgi:hypothetical protein
MSDFEVVDSIIICQQCGARNRVGTYASTLTPVCGKCRASLQTAIETYRHEDHSSPESTFANPPRAHRNAKLYVGLGIIFVVLGVGAVVLLQEKSTPPRSASEYKSTERYVPSNPPVRVTPQPHQAPTENRRLPNGTIIRGTGLYGQGTLTVKNGLASDAAAKLVNKRDNVCEAYFYVCANDQFTLSGINEGDYRLLFGIGEDWDQSTEFFTRNQAVSEFNKPMDFETFKEQRGNAIYTNWTVMEVTLHPVPGGNIKTHTVSAEEFQKY